MVTGLRRRRQCSRRSVVIRTATCHRTVVGVIGTHRQRIGSHDERRRVGSIGCRNLDRTCCTGVIVIPFGEAIAGIRLSRYLKRCSTRCGDLHLSVGARPRIIRNSHFSIRAIIGSHREDHLRRLHIVHPRTPDKEHEKEDDAMYAAYHVCEIISKSAAKLQLFSDISFSNRTIRISNRTKVKNFT